MSRISSHLALLAIEAASIEMLDEILALTQEEKRKRYPHHHCAVRGWFAGMSFTNPTGEMIMATQVLIVGTVYTAPLSFVDASGTGVPGPIGVVSASDPSVSVSLSADGQSCNVTMSASLPSPATLTWHDPAGVVPDFTASISDTVVVPGAASGSFGTFVEGTTA